MNYGVTRGETRGKRITARMMLVFLGFLFLYAIFGEDPTSGEYARFLTPFIFTSVMALYGADAIFKDRQDKEEREGNVVFRPD